MTMVIAEMTEERKLELQQIAADALMVQDACNLSGVVHSFERAIKILCEERNRLGKGTDWVNSHPVCVLFAEQISHLTSGTAYSDAYEACEKMTED